MDKRGNGARADLKARFKMRHLNMGVLQIVLCVVFSCVLARAAGATYNSNNMSPVPFGWEYMCTYRRDSQIVKSFVDYVPPAGHVVRLQCGVSGNTGITWHFQTLRDWLRGYSGVSVFVEVRCTNGGQISLPWPMKANGLVGISISGCILRGKYADFGNPEISVIPDQLRVLEIRNSVWVSDGSGFDKITSPGGLANLTSDYDCGQDSTIEYLITNNVSDAIELENVATKPPELRLQFQGGFLLDWNSLLGGNSHPISDSSETETHLLLPYQENEWLDMDVDMHDRDDSSDSLMDLFSLYLPKRGLFNSGLHKRELAPERTTTKSASDEFEQLLQRLLSLDVTCHYEKLRVLDESNLHLLPIHHFTLMVQGARYPELKVMNYSRAGIREMPQELQDFRMYFPKLQYLDLSRNFLTKIPLTSRFGEASGGDSLTLDVRRNLISSLSVEDLLLWAQNTDVFVDIRDNPFHCGCQMIHFLQRIKSEAFFAGNLRRYKYIRDLQCASPSHLKGLKLSNVNPRCTSATSLAVVSKTPESSPAVSSTTTGIIIGCGSALMVISFVAFIVLLTICGGSGRSNKHIDTNNPGVLSQAHEECCVINEEDLCTKL